MDAFLQMTLQGFAWNFPNTEVYLKELVRPPKAQFFGVSHFHSGHTHARTYARVQTEWSDFKEYTCSTKRQNRNQKYRQNLHKLAWNTARRQLSVISTQPELSHTVKTRNAKDKRHFPDTGSIYSICLCWLQTDQRIRTKHILGWNIIGIIIIAIMCTKDL